MHEEKHPSELNIFKQYRRAVGQATSTSRLSNKDWYREALDLNVQIHCYIKDGGGADCFLHVKSKNFYEPIGRLNARQLQNYDELEKFINQTLANGQAAKAKSIGVILYLADELSLASLGPEYEEKDEIPELRELITAAPKEVLEDKTVSIESHAWRVFPYTGAPDGQEFATAVAISRKYEGTLGAFREIGEEMNLPICTAALCAPLCALASVPLFSSADSSGAVTLFNYKEFTLLAFFNKACELMMLRYMPHSKGAAAPANIGPAVLATSTAYELEDPTIQIIPVFGQDVDNAVMSLQKSMKGSEIILVDIGDVNERRNLPESIPLEMVVATQYIDPEVFPLASNETFTSYETDGWQLQDFLAPSSEELEMMPNQKDIGLLKVGRIAVRLAAILLVAVVIYSGYTIWGNVSSEVWLHTPKKSGATVAMLDKEMNEYGHWDNLLKDRSKAWVNMELINQIIPTDSSVILSGVKHTVTQKPEQQNGKLGFEKAWIINGAANEKGLKHLQNISTREGVKIVFAKVAEITGNSAYLPDVGKRDITIKIKQKGNSRFNTINPTNPGDKLKNSFTMEIVQSFSGDDDMAISGFTKTN